MLHLSRGELFILILLMMHGLGEFEQVSIGVFNEFLDLIFVNDLHSLRSRLFFRIELLKLLF